MGGCATKPKVLKADNRSIPAPPPEPKKEAVAEEAEEGVDVVAEKGDREAEGDVVGDDVKSKDVDEANKVDDGTSKPESLGNLLNENENKSVTETETDNNAPSEPTKTEPLDAADQESTEEKKPTEPIESTKEPEPLSVEPQAAPEATATLDGAEPETEKKETSSAAAVEGEEGKTEVAK
ncbi:patellin-1-like [Hibiscus syriacus]|uniref:patellin-1-like n=1 Tax=Hibiscus syriacus TaxID=106335 RepID=UPI0019234B17|nr:patellin-1-like [Hibiscus syriacus]XP_039014585.1 patellin-1-like [Hibiscus syriacus]